MTKVRFIEACRGFNCQTSKRNLRAYSQLKRRLKDSPLMRRV